MALRYNLDQLGWLQFEQLTQSLLKAAFDVRMQSSSGSRDKGRDAFFEGALTLPNGAKETGYFVFQCKFLSQAVDAKEVQTRFVRDLPKLSRLYGRHGDAPARHYFAITNKSLSAPQRDSLIDAIKSIAPPVAPTVYDGNDICDLLDQFPVVRQSFPQLLGIRDIRSMLASLLDRPHMQRSKMLMERAAELSRVFVPTKSWTDAVKTLSRRRFVVLTGPPEVGKTCIAHMLGFLYAADGWDFFDCRVPEDVLTLREDSRPQVFLVDDAFGSTEFQVDLARKWERELDTVLRGLSSNHCIIWTTRPAPLAEALKTMRRQGRGDQFPELGKVLVDVSALRVREKALILYRHAKASDCNKNTLDILRTHAPEIVKNAFFTPERARRFVSNGLVQVAAISAGSQAELRAAIAEAIRREISQPTSGMISSFGALSQRHRQVLYAMATTPVSWPTEETLLEIYATAFGPMSDTELASLVDDLGEHFLRITVSRGASTERHLQWMHPSWRDVVIDAMERDTVARRRMLEHGPIAIVKLALSIAGGTFGERSLPLLQDKEDLKIVCSRIRSDVARSDCSMARLGEWLIVVYLALSEDDADGWRTRDLCSAASDVLQAVRSASATFILDVDTIEDYIDLSIKLPELAPPPDFRPTFNHLLKEAVRAESDCEWRAEYVDRVVLFMENVKRIEPRFFEQDDREAKLQRVLSALAQATEVFLQYDDEIDVKNASYRATVWEELADRCPALERLVPQSRDAWRRIEGMARARAELLRESSQDDRDNDDYDSVESLRDSDTEIREIFSDL